MSKFCITYIAGHSFKIEAEIYLLILTTALLVFTQCITCHLKDLSLTQAQVLAILLDVKILYLN